MRRSSRRQQAVDPGAERRQRLVLQGALEHAPDARQVRQVVGLAVALQQADEQADDAGMALGGHQRETGAAKSSASRPGLAEIAGEAGGVHGGRDVAARVLDQRHQIVGGMAALGVLEVEQAAGLHAGAGRQPQQIVLVVVAQQQRVGASAAASARQARQAAR